MLKRPGKADRQELDIIVQEAADAVELLLLEGVDTAMRAYNGRDARGDTGP